jgi:pimeloyl-ACP methyl ester carboxylesterase
MPMLAVHRRVAALDFVDPPPAGDAPRLDGYVAQARALIRDQCADGPAVVLGYSFGAVVAASLAATHPEAVSDLILVCGWARTDVHQRLRNDIWFRLHETDPATAARFSVLVSYSPQWLRETGESGIDVLADRVGDGDAWVPKMRLNRSVDIEEQLARIAARTLVIGCTEDVMAPVDHSELLFGAIHDARLARVRSGHAVLQERPAEIRTLVERFLGHREAHPPGTIMEPSNV